MKRNWTDSRDGVEWEIKAIALMGGEDPGEAPMIGETRYTLWFSSQSGAIHRLVVDRDVGSRLDELSDEDLVKLLDEARE